MRGDGSLTCWLTLSEPPLVGLSEVPSGTSFVAVSVGHAHACALASDGGVQCWGDDAFGESSPPSDGFASISAGDFHTCGVRTDGQVRCWGLEADGQSWPP